MFSTTKRLLLGRPIRSERMGDTLLPKRLALPVFCSDPLSSNAYATEEMLRALSLGGLALFFLTPWVAAAVIVLLTVVVISYRQTCQAYPHGGGAYAVSRANLGRTASLVAASALLIDYVLTVAVSVAAGVDAITSAFLELKPHAVLISLGLVAVLAVMNLRGVRESGTVFAIPTYGFVAVVFLMIGWGFWRLLFGQAPAIHRHYRRVNVQLTAGPAGVPLPSRVHAVVLLSRLHLPTLQALAYARATRPDSLTALTVASNLAEAHQLETEWTERNIPVPLTVVDAPYRDITGPVLRYVTELRTDNPRDLVVVYIPEYVVGHWWEQLLHNQSALRLKARLLFERGVIVTSVPWQLASSTGRTSAFRRAGGRRHRIPYNWDMTRRPRPACRGSGR